MLHVHTCTDIRLLVRHLAESLGQDNRHPLQARHVIVENVGMARWLTMELAHINGHCTNVHFPLPWSFVWQQLLAPLLEDKTQEDRWSAEVLRWRIARILPDWLDKEEFAALKAWQGNQRSEFGLLELSARLARCYDAYQVYRPDWLLEWEGDSGAARLFNGATKPPDAHPFSSWQQLLWRELVRDTSQPHRARLLANWLSLPKEKRPGPGADSLVHYFCPSSLTRVLGLVLGAMPVSKMEVMVHTASEDYWSDLEKDNRRVRRRKWLLPEELSVAEQAELEPRILLNNGRERAELLDLLLEEESHLDDLEAPAQPHRDTCLDRLATSLRELKNPYPVANELDDSLRVFSCHSLTRQAEVLHDQVMRLMRLDSSLRPSDFLVLVPDMPAAQPAIEAVWESIHPDARIPWKIFGTPPWRGDIGRCLLAALSLNQRQWTNAALLELFDCASLRRRLSLNGNVRGSLAALFSRAGYRWGRDHESTGLAGLDGARRNTLESLLDRLTLGLVTQDAGLISGTLPLDTERDDRELMEALLILLEMLKPIVSDPETMRSMEDWVEVTLSFLGAAFKPEGIEEQERKHLSRVLREMAANARVGDCDTRLSQATFHRLLEERIAANQGIRGGGFDGSLIFAPMLAVNKVPARVIAVLGMDDGSFPRGSSRDELDLSQEERRPGDRSPRDQDRGLFLDALLQARDHLLFFYTGREQKDNTKRQPSACLSELLDSLGQSSGAAGMFITEVPLNRHDSKHFQADTLLQSCDPDSLASASLSCKPSHVRTSHLPLANPVAELPTSLSLQELIRFYRNPAVWLLKRSLGLYLPRDTDKPEELEPIAHDRLANYALRAKTLELQAKGLSEVEQRAMLEAGGRLAWQAQGEEDQAVLREWLEKLEAQEKALTPQLGEAVDSIEFDFTLNKLRLVGEIDRLHQKARLVRHHNDDKPQTHHCFAHWITHLALQIVRPNAQMATYIMHGSKHVRFKPIPSEKARAHLEVLVAHCLKGTREWMPWIPELVVLKNKTPWFGISGFDRKDYVSNNPALRLLRNGEDWTAHNPVSEKLEQLASELVVPMQEATDVS